MSGHDAERIDTEKGTKPSRTGAKAVDQRKAAAEAEEAQAGQGEQTTQAEAILGLQQTHGNAYVQRLLKSRKVQTKLTVNPPDDQYERAADRIGEKVSKSGFAQRQAAPEEEEEQVQTKLQRQAAPEEEEEQVQTKLQRQAAPEEEEEQVQTKLQRQATPEEEEVQAKSEAGAVPEVTSGLEDRINAARGSGDQLPDSVRSSIEPQLGRDFSQVRLHTDSEADALSRELGAKAFTTGQDVFFRSGDYQPDSDEGRRLLGHELTHVVQQGGAAVSRQPEAAPPAGKAAAPQGTPEETGTPKAENANLSGKRWRAVADEKYPDTANVDDLEDPFKTNVKNLIDAMTKRGAGVKVTSVKRPKARAWLMHWAWEIARGNKEPPKDDPHGTSIKWDHGSSKATKEAAEEMVKAFNMAYTASLTSNHITGKAVDMTITNMPDSWEFEHGGKTEKVELGKPNDGQNPKLWDAAKTHFSVVKKQDDRPHWSVDGK